MDKNILVELIEKNYTQQQIADELYCSQTNVKYYLKKYNLKTKTTQKRGNGMCVTCKNSLKGRQTKYCSLGCKSKELYSKNTNNYQSQKERAIRRKILFIKILGGKCKNCGYKKNLSALHFHHRIPIEKSIKIDSRSCSNTKYEILLEEVKKCDLLCANCHAEIHYSHFNDLI